MSQSILVVDNEAETTGHLRATLGPVGYDVDEAIGGRQPRKGIERRRERGFVPPIRHRHLCPGTHKVAHHPGPAVMQTEADEQRPLPTKIRLCRCR